MLLTAVVGPKLDSVAGTHLAATNAVLLEVRLPTRPSNVVMEGRSISGGMVIQRYDRATADDLEFEVLGGRQADLTDDDWTDVWFGLHTVKFARTNAATCVLNRETLSISSAEGTRFWAIETALRRCDSALIPKATLVCDGRLTHEDSVALAAGSGVRNVVAPRGIITKERIANWLGPTAPHFIFCSRRFLFS